MYKRDFTYRTLKRFAGIILLVFFKVLIIYARISDKPTEEKSHYFKSKARKCEKQGDIYGAIDHYSKFLKLESKNAKITYKLANMCFDTRNYSEANAYYDSVINLKGEKYPLAYYRKGMVCMNLEKYDDATETFTVFRRIYRHTKDPHKYRKMASIFIDNCTWAKNQPATGYEFEVNHVEGDLNHTNIDFSPFPVNSTTMIYGAEYTNPSIGIEPVRQIYVAKKNNNQWETAGLLKGEINNPGYNTGNATISPGGQRMYFTRTRKNWKGEFISELYISYFNDNKWSEPQKLPFPVNNENYTSTQPAIGRNPRSGREVLYFASDREGGKGRLDIWYTEYNDKTGLYSKPRSLPSSVNTSGDECCPFYNLATTTLYFSSNGRAQCYGGYDIYKIMGSGNKWDEAASMPKPINSSYDDYYFTVLYNNREGFFTSNRPGSLTLDNGSCCDDIFSFSANDCDRISSYGIVRNSTDFDLYNRLNQQFHLELSYPKDSILLTDVPVELYLTGEEESNEILITTTSTDKNGVYRFKLERNKQYKIRIKNYGYFEKKFYVNTEGLNCSDTMKFVTTRINYLPGINFRLNIYYELDKFRLTDDAKKLIDTTLLPLFDIFPNAIIEIGSHTDNIGTDDYNIKLSQRRAQGVVDYLISKGIIEERLIAKGYGMRSPIAPNTNSDGSDNPEGRQLNRRTEIKIVGQVSSIELNE